MPADQLLDNGIDDLLKLHHTQPGAFSAATLSPPGKRTIVMYNPISLTGQPIAPTEAKTDGRTRSNVAHEFGHIVLRHDVRRTLKIGEHHFFTCNPEQEEEANWLAGALLLPRPLLLAEASKNSGDGQIASAHHVTIDMARFRMNATGVRMQIARARKRSGA